MEKLETSWAGVVFMAVVKRDGRRLHRPGLFGFVRREADDACQLLFVGHADDLATHAGPRHPAWAYALALGFNELHVHLVGIRRIDRLQLCDRIIRRVQPLLNVVDGAEDRERQDALRRDAG